MTDAPVVSHRQCFQASSCKRYGSQSCFDCNHPTMATVQITEYTDYIAAYDYLMSCALCSCKCPTGVTRIQVR